VSLKLRLLTKFCAFVSKWVPDAIISCSHNVRDTHIENGYSANILHVIPNGYDVNLYQPDLAAKKKIYQELELSMTSCLIGYVGRYHPQKCHLAFLAAVEKNLEENQDYQVLLCGKHVDNHNKDLMRFIKSSKYASRYHLLGLRSDIPTIMAALDLLVLASSYEGFPNVLCEAMASGVPCVTTDVGDARLIVGKLGICVKTNDPQTLSTAIGKMLSTDANEMIALKQACRDSIVERFSIAAIVEQYEKFYNDVLR